MLTPTETNSSKKLPNIGGNYSIPNSPSYRPLPKPKPKPRPQPRPREVPQPRIAPANPQPIPTPINNQGDKTRTKQ